MPDSRTVAPEDTAVRVALWRALHLRLDPPPHAITDEIGLRLVDPDPDWVGRGDMHPEFTVRLRAATAARARFIEDLVVERAARGIDQYVLLGAGLDTFAQRRPDIAAALTVFEVDQPGPQEWKRKRLTELGFDIPQWLRLVPVDFEVDSWWDALLAAGFDPHRPAVIASTGVSMYLTRETNRATMRRISTLAPGSTYASTFTRPVESVEPAEDRQRMRTAMQGARANGTPFLSFYRPDQITELARDAGFRTAQHISAAELTERYFAGRPDGLRLSNGEEFLLATT